MTRDEIDKLWEDSFEPLCTNEDARRDRFAALVAAAEREAAARTLDALADEADRVGKCVSAMVVRTCAAAIRARATDKGAIE